MGVYDYIFWFFGGYEKMWNFKGGFEFFSWILGGGAAKKKLEFRKLAPPPFTFIEWERTDAAKGLLSLEWQHHQPLPERQQWQQSLQQQEPQPQPLCTTITATNKLSMTMSTNNIV